MYGAALMLGLAGSAHAAPAKDKPPTIASLSADLLHAPNAATTTAILAAMDSLRRAHTDAATTLLLNRATRDLGAQKSDDAIADLTDAMALQPDLTILRRDRAGAQIAAGHYDAAITDLGVYLQAEPGDPQGWATLTEAEMARHDERAAFAAWQRVLALAPQMAAGQKHLNDLRTKAFGRPT